MPSRRSRTLRSQLVVLTALLVVVLIGTLLGTRTKPGSSPGSATTTTRQSQARSSLPAATASTERVTAIIHPEIGFASSTKLRDHYRKHGKEFGDITQAQYLAMAQALRDAPLSSQVIETEQVGGTTSRFDRFSGAFIAFNPNLVIRTFFRPDDGEAYFWRAAKTSH